LKHHWPYPPVRLPGTVVKLGLGPAIPPLAISTYSNQPVLFFPPPAPFPASVGTNYVLEMTTNLASGKWAAVSNGVSLISLEITNVSSPAFFRPRPE